MARSSVRVLAAAACATALLMQVVPSISFASRGGAGATTPHGRHAAVTGSTTGRDLAKTRLAAIADRYNPPSDLRAPWGTPKTESGLAWKVLKEGCGDGKKPWPSATVYVHYTGWKASSGQMFDSSYMRAEPTAFTVSEVIAGWTEGLQDMEVGEKRRFWIPGELAYGTEEIDLGNQGAAPLGDLCFDVELMRIDDPGEGIIKFFAGVFAFLVIGTVLVSTFTEQPERREYDTEPAFGLYLNKPK